MEARVDNTVVLIPSYNEARTIGSIVRDITALGFSVLVIDDGSADKTQKEALDNGAMVIRNKENLGKGGSIREGIGYVLNKMSYKWMILMDGDGQHHPEDIPFLIEAASRPDRVDIIVGNRMHETKTMPTIRYLTNKLTSWIISMLCGQKIPDTQCGFRLLRVDPLKNMNLTSDRYDIETEMLLEGAKMGLKIKSVSIRTIYGNEESQIHPVHDTVRFFGIIIRNLFGDGS